MVVGKWNYKIQDYDPHKIPDEWHCPVSCDDTDEIINCCQCGREIKFGESYTSKEIQDDYALGFRVCDKCHVDEWRRKVESCR